MRESAGCPWGGGAPIALRPSQGPQTPSLNHLARMGRVWEPRFWERRYRFVRDSARSPRIRGGPGRDTIGHPQPFSLGRSRYSPISTDSSPSASFHRWTSRGGCIGAPVTHGPAQLANRFCLRGPPMPGPIERWRSPELRGQARAHAHDLDGGSMGTALSAVSKP